MTFWIDPRFQINYSSYYLQGILSIVGKNGMHFRVIEDISVNDYDDFRKGVAVIYQREDREYRIFIDTWDSCSIHQRYYDWCDVYAKVNVSFEDKDADKLLPIGPSFGVQLWNPIETVVRGLRNYVKAFRKVVYRPSFRDYMLNYIYTFVRRLPYTAYRPEPNDERDYVFAMHTLWYDPFTDLTTNAYRAQFCRKCKAIFSRFEGGLFYIPNKAVKAQFSNYSNYLTLYSDLIVCHRISLKKYLNKSKKSAIVFNSPSVEGCLGWKLGEYLAMGKAIISMPLNRVLPEDFVNCEHYMLAENQDEIEARIQKIRNDGTLRRKLEANARSYFTQYLSPEAVIYRIIAKAES